MPKRPRTTPPATRALATLAAAAWLASLPLAALAQTGALPAAPAAQAVNTPQGTAPTGPQTATPSTAKTVTPAVTPAVTPTVAPTLAPTAAPAPARRPSGPAAPRRARAEQSDRDPDLVTYGQREDVLQLAAQIARDHALDEAWVRAQIGKARMLPAVRRLIMPAPAGTAKNWAAYRARFLTPDRIRAGSNFWRTHERWLAAAETHFGVPAELVVGIIGVETFYGRIMGDFRVLDALATLSLDFPSGRSDRSPFFREELGQLLKLAHTENIDPASLKGSFAGAMGLGQFMPGSINRFAVDFDNDRHIDMVGNPADVIGSVAHYLARHGWQPGMATHHAVKPPVDSTARALLLAPDIKPTFTAEQMRERGAELDAAGQAHAGPLALVELQNGPAAPSYVAGTANFYAVTRYNWSAYYALAVIDLGRAVAQARQATPP